MGKRIKRSHYLSRFYLTGFAVDRELHLFDLERGKSWSSSPENAAIEKYFYAIDIPGEDPDVMEKILATLEGDFCRVLRWIDANGRIPEGEDFISFLNFVGLTGARTPPMRKAMGRSVDRGVKARFRELLSTPDGWNRFREDLAQVGCSIPDEEYEEFRRFAESENYDVNLDQTSHVRMMAVEMMDEMLAVLAPRRWSLGIAAPGAPDFLTSSAPLAVWPARTSDLLQPITVSSQNTVLSFPLTRRLIALGRHEPCPPVLGIEAGGVALCNTWTIANATQVFSAQSDFAFMMLPERRIGGRAELFGSYRRQRDGVI